MQISTAPMRVYKHRHLGKGLVWHSFRSEVCVEKAEPLTMATLLPNASKQDQRAVILFLAAEGQKPVDIHRRMRNVYGEACLSKTTVVEWCSKFSAGRGSTQDANRSGRPSTSNTENNRRAVEDAILADRRIAIRALSNDLDISFGSVQNIIRRELGYRKVCSQWIPRALNTEQKTNRMAVCLKHLLRFNVEGNTFLERIVAGDESWCHHWEPESKASTMQWRHPSSPRPKKFRSQPSAGKVMLTLFLDHQGPLLIDFKDPGVSITGQRYCETLERLRRAIKAKRPGKLRSGVILLHDNARPHIANVVTQKLHTLRWETLEHPPYSPDLSPCDYHAFGPLKKSLKGRRFLSDEEVKQAVSGFFQQQEKEFYQTGIFNLVKRWDDCLNAKGDYP